MENNIASSKETTKVPLDLESLSVVTLVKEILAKQRGKKSDCSGIRNE